MSLTGNLTPDQRTTLQINQMMLSTYLRSTWDKAVKLCQIEFDQRGLHPFSETLPREMSGVRWIVTRNG